MSFLVDQSLHRPVRVVDTDDTIDNLNFSQGPVVPVVSSEAQKGICNSELLIESYPEQERRVHNWKYRNATRQIAFDDISQKPQTGYPNNIFDNAKKTEILVI